MTPSFIAALFVALLMIVFWRVVLVGAVAFLLAAVLIGMGTMADTAEPDTGPATGASVQHIDAPPDRLVAEPGE